jgi:hypothetical protein
MSTTTQILFNSPALNSLKREQLIKLCKIHSIKANGKNVDLIDRLKQHATSLPPDAPLSLAVRSEHISDDEPSYDPGLRDTLRPSEQWEIVVGDIDESPESLSTNPINSPGGFETAVSTCASLLVTIFLFFHLSCSSVCCGFAHSKLRIVFRSQQNQSQLGPSSFHKSWRFSQ